MPSFYIPLSGLNADSTALNTIANNLSNMNTTAFKEQTTNFSDLFYQQVGTTGAGGEIQLGTGVQVASNSTNFTGGSIASTGVSTDVAIDGTGFFVLNNGGGQQLYTRAGNFQLSSNGTLESTQGQAVMGYPATNGVVNSSGGLTEITIPTGQVLQPAATTFFSLSQNLDSRSPIGTQTSGQVQIYDSLGKSYEATVTYTNLGNNKWSYAITLPDTLSAVPATAAAATTLPVAESTPAATSIATAATAAAPVLTPVSSAVTQGAQTTATTAATLAPATPVASSNTTTLAQNSNSALGTTTLSYNFATTGTVNQAGSSLTIVEGSNTAIVTPLSAGESPTIYAGEVNSALTLAGITDLTASGTGGVLSISGPTASSFSVTGTVQQDVALTTANYNFVTSGGLLATVDPTSTLAITEGALGPVTVPAFTSGETVSAYATALQGALTTAGIADVTVSGSGGILSITGPSNMSTSGTVKQDFSGTRTSYTFGTYTDPTTGLSSLSSVAPSSSLTITGPTTSGGTATTALPTFTGTPETLANYATDLQTALTTAGITGVTVTANTATGQLAILGPSTMTIAGNVNQDMVGTTNLYNFASHATVDPSTALTITGKTAFGAIATITAPTITAGETTAQYATALMAAISTAGITNVAVSSTAGQLSIVGANMSLAGSVTQDLADTTINYNFGSSATVNPATNLIITGPATAGGTATIIAPAITSGETVAQYAADLRSALTTAGIDTGPDGVSVTTTGSELTIVGPAAALPMTGTARQDLTATTISYNLGTSGGTIATIDPATNLTISGQTSTGITATTAAPTITIGETLAQYVTALTSALTTAGIAGVTVSSTAGGQLSITGTNLSTTGNIIQNPVASSNASGTLTFNSSGNLIYPAANPNNITFTGLSDSAAAMNMSWNLFGANGAGSISQTAAASGQSSQNQNGFTSGQYQSFAIGSDGIVTATYSNGQSQDVGQLAIATVSNLQGLVDTGSTEYQATASSGLATVGVAGAGGRGILEGSSLEASNVNISAEFSNLIIAQRAFEANAKAVTTFDTVTQETINMIH